MPKLGRKLCLKETIQGRARVPQDWSKKGWSANHQEQEWERYFQKWKIWYWDMYCTSIFQQQSSTIFLFQLKP